jgi:hypothetical protein
VAVPSGVIVLIILHISIYYGKDTDLDACSSEKNVLNEHPIVLLCTCIIHSTEHHHIGYYK